MLLFLLGDVVWFVLLRILASIDLQNTCTHLRTICCLQRVWCFEEGGSSDRCLGRTIETNNRNPMKFVFSVWRRLQLCNIVCARSIVFIFPQQAVHNQMFFHLDIFAFAFSIFVSSILLSRSSAGFFSVGRGESLPVGRYSPAGLFGCGCQFENRFSPSPPRIEPHAPRTRVEPQTRPCIRFWTRKLQTVLL